LALVLSRIRPGSAPLRGPLHHSAGKTLRQTLAWRLKAERLPLYLGAGLAIGLVGIGVNALLFQHERRPAPLFGSLVAPFSPPAQPPAAPPVPKPASAEREAPAAPTPVAVPPARPAETAEGSPSDPITDLLRGESHVDGAHLILAAQTALAKLGYPVKPDGNDGLATQQAVRDFERAHGLPISTEISPRLVKQLTGAARAGGR
jgi:Putative peptidoglycan binding domain